jgi:hypothetical protein
METTCGQLEIHIKQLREQLTAAVVTANTQHKEKGNITSLSFFDFGIF